MRYTLFAFILALVATPALAATWEDWDNNADGDITEEEWDESKAGSQAFDDWDTDGDGVVDEGEYSTGMFGTFDANDDGNITEEEWDKNFDLDRTHNSRYAGWDINNDGTLDEQEFSSGMFERYDANDNDTVTAEEWHTATPLDI